MMIFRILCGEWVEPLWDCMRATSASVSSMSNHVDLTCIMLIMSNSSIKNSLWLIENLYMQILHQWSCHLVWSSCSDLAASLSTRGELLQPYRFVAHLICWPGILWTLQGQRPRCTLAVLYKHPYPKMYALYPAIDIKLGGPPWDKLSSLSTNMIRIPRLTRFKPLRPWAPTVRGNKKNTVHGTYCAVFA